MSYLSPPYTDDDDARSTSSSSNSSIKGYETKLALKLRSVDPERAARLAARAARNRVSAQKSRDRKKKHVSEMEQESNQLRAEKAELEERVRTLENLVKTLLMNQNLSPTTQLDSFSVAAPREDVLSPTDLLSKSENQSFKNTTKPCNHSSSHHQQKCPAAGMDSILAYDERKGFEFIEQLSNGFSERDLNGIATLSQIGSSIDTNKGSQIENTETGSISSASTEFGQDMFETPFCFSSSASTADTMSLAEENLWIAQCLESAALVNDQGNTRDSMEHDGSQKII